MNWEDPIIDAALTDTGMRRSNNQDSYTIVRATTPEAWRHRGHLFLVADGMGAHAVGELASKMACDNIPHTYNKAKNATSAEAVMKAYQAVSAQIHGRASANKDFEGMGTTATTLLLLPEGALIAHVGDSRAYRTRAGRIDQLSFDHSLVWELVRRNHLSPEQAAKAVPKNVITRSLGPDPNVEVDLEGPLAVAPGDVFLLCSDGLSGVIDDPEMGVFCAQFHPEDACRYLLHLANLRGGPDNITVVIVRVGAWVDPDRPASESAAPAPDTGPRRERRFRLGGLLNLLHRKAEPELVEDHPYRSAACRLDEMLVDNLADLVRRTQATAIDQAWPLDWSVFTDLQRRREEARAANDLRGALRSLGEGIVHLGLAGRIHRKAQAAQVS